MEIAKKWSGNGFGPSQMTCPKSGQKMVWEFFGPSQLTCPKSGQKVPKKWSKNGLSKIWGQKTAQKVVKNWSKNGFLANRGGGLRPPPQKGARALRALPFLALYLPKSVKKVSGKCLGDTFLTFSGHFSSANPSTRTLSRHFLDIFLGGCQEAPKGILGHFLDIFRQFLVLTPFTTQERYMCCICCIFCILFF